MIPSWYDVLDVADDASTDEIRSAWQASVAGLDPSDRRFKQRNRAAEVLLDPERRAAHDRDLAAQDTADADDDLADEQPRPVASPAASADRTATEPRRTAKPARTTKTGTTAKANRGTSASDAGTSTVVLEKGDVDRLRASPAQATGPSRGLVRATVVLGVLALVLVLTTLAALVGVAGSDGDGGGGGDSDLPDSREIAAARKAAEIAVGPVLSYDYRDLDKSFAAARTYMTPKYVDTYDQTVAAIVQENAGTTKTIVTTEVVNLDTSGGSRPASSVVRTGEGRVDVLLFVNRPTRNSAKDEVYRDEVTLRMVDVDGRWLVDCLVTQPGATC